MKHDFFEIESVIDYHFKNRDILFTALTHPSYANEHNLSSYDRLEFVGDSILDFVIADELYNKYRDADEGVLTKMRANIVSRDPLAYVVTKYNMLDYMLISGAEHREMSTHEISNIFEALVGAIYYDGGLDDARRFIVKFLGRNIANAKIEHADSKSLLQEYIQARQLGRITYKTISHDFFDNVHTYRVECQVAGHVSNGEGKNTKEAEKKAARKMLEMLRHREK